MVKVGIDIGHGSNTFPPGKGFYKGGKAYHEHSFNAKLGIRLKEILESHDIEVVFAQQPNSRDIPLGERGDIYKEEGVDLVISLHANWNNNSAVNGRCYFYWNTSSNAKKLATLIRDEVKNSGYETHGSGLHASIRGTWTDLYITRALPMTSVLAEHGFMGGSKDFDYIFGSKQGEYVEDMAKVNAKGITSFLGISYKGVSKPDNKPSPGGKYYRVQVGAFKDVANVAAYADQVESKTGFNTYVTEVGGFLKVQIGAFKNKSNAESRLSAVKSKGYKDAFITTETGAAVPETEPRNDHSDDTGNTVVWVETKNKGKELEVLSSSLNYYDTQRWSNPTDSKPRGYKWKIDNLYKVNGSLQYRVQDDAGDLYYTSARNDLVKVGSTYTGNTPKANLTVDGRWGRQTSRALQRALGTPVDGIISNQYSNAATRAITGGVTWGTTGSTVIKALQRKVGATVDGLFGPQTVRLLQRYLGTPVDGVISNPSTMVREMQRRLNAGTF